jgi:hypothetical protein
MTKAFVLKTHLLILIEEIALELNITVKRYSAGATILIRQYGIEWLIEVKVECE